MTSEKTKNIISTAICAVLSLFLVCLILLLSVHFSVSTLKNPDTIVEIVQKVDYTKILENNQYVKNIISEYGIDAQTANAIIKSDIAREIITLYADDTIGIIFDSENKAQLTNDAVSQLVEKHIAEINAISKDAYNTQIPEHIIKEQVSAALIENSDKIMSILPDIEEVRTVVKTIRVPNEVKKVLSTQTAILLASLAVIMGAGIFIIGHKKGKGLLFLGIVYLVSALLITLFIILGQINFIEFLGLNSLDIFANLLDATITRCADSLAYGVLISVILGAAFIIAFVLINRKKAMAEASKIEPDSTQQKNASV